MEIRHLDTLLAIARAGSFTAAADELRTVQSNVSEQVRQLEVELGVTLLVRGRKGAVPTESGAIVLDRAARIRRELDAMRSDLAMVQELRRGEASLGVVGTASRWIIPEVVERLRARAPGVRLHVAEGSSERLAAEVLGQELAQAIVTEPVNDHRLTVAHILDEALVGIAPADHPFGDGPVSLVELAALPLVLPPTSNPLRAEIEAAATAAGVELRVPVEVDGVRLIADLVSAGAGAAILPETAVPEAPPGVRVYEMLDLPPRRLAIVAARDSYLSLADRAVRSAVGEVVGRSL